MLFQEALLQEKRMMISSVGILLTFAALLVGANSAPDNECIKTLIVTAVTSNKLFAESDARFNLDVTFKTGFLNLRREMVTYKLYNRPGVDDTRKNHGDTWYFERSEDEDCMKSKNIIHLKIESAEGFDECHDAWNIETMQIFAKISNETGDIVLLSVADKVHKWIDYNVVHPSTLTMDRGNIIETCSSDDCPCIDHIMIYTTTSRDIFAGTNGDISLTLGYYGYNATVKLYDRPRNDLERNIGDLWYYNIGEFFSDICVSFIGIDLVRLSAETNHGWKVRDIYVTADFKDSNHYGLIAAGYPLESWVDGNFGPGFIDVPLRNTCSS